MHTCVHTCTHAHMCEHAHEHMNTHPLLHVHTRACAQKLPSFSSSPGVPPRLDCYFIILCLSDWVRNWAHWAWLHWYASAGTVPGLHTAPCLSRPPPWPSDCPFSSWMGWSLQALCVLATKVVSWGHSVDPRHSQSGFTNRKRRVMKQDA